MVLKRVVLPAPLGPIRAKISLVLISKLISSTALRPPKRLVSPRTCRMAASATSATLGLLPQVEDGLVGGSLGQLLLAHAAWNEPLRAQKHDDHQDDAVEQEIEALDLVVQADPVAVLVVEEAEADGAGCVGDEVGQPGQDDVEHAVDGQRAHDHSRNIPHAAEHDHE